ncbi:hypothetical protein DOTSEDRAFT_86165 [Dothistroma septosporum NZE10]|uniref:Thioredoxin domain-containing protein n=1 Tax=Dothistroma septosporum (strain NZE10 / CBS 128990) TaxID=675120 RepID=N1PW61_DOTSN|nr:hypothetical protein DOTSEDRAFT_86165 [Dothistroma septosporum NZE10]
MEVQLYVYDLTRGMARMLSQQYLGIQIDAVYHTSLVFGGVEYFYGAGVQTCYPGKTHHGQPMQIIRMGNTELPLDTILDYLESLKDVYTPESYDLFAHNCNNFTNDFATFLVGKGIPDHITSLPKKVLDTPFGQMLRPQLDASMWPVTQAEVPQQSRPVAQSARAASKAPVTSGSASHTNGGKHATSSLNGKVVNLTSPEALQERMASASDTCTIIFFTSATCAPCRMAYPMFDSLAEEHPQALFVKADISAAHEIASKYSIRATPTFVTFCKGAKQDEWTGADLKLLKANVERLIQQTFPPHHHLTINVPTLQHGSMEPVTYVKIPPLEKLITKLDSAATEKDIVALRSFVEKRIEDPRNAQLPDLHDLSKTFRSLVFKLPTEVRFAAVDLLRCAMVEPRVSGFFAVENQPKTASALINHVNHLQGCPHNLRLVTIHLACNTFSSSIYVRELFNSDDDSIALLIQLITSSLLDETHPTTRVAAGSLAFNLATANYRVRREEGQDALAESEQVELAASILETLTDETNVDAQKVLLLAFAYLVYCAPEDGELLDLCRALDAKAKVLQCKAQRPIAKEVAAHNA